MDLPMGVDWSRMDHRRSLLSVVDEKFRQLDTSGIAESMDSYYRDGVPLMHSERPRKPSGLKKNPTRYARKYGRTSLGQGALLARRLVEAGVRFVTVSRGFNTWDHHKTSFPTWPILSSRNSTMRTPRCSKTSISAACWTRRSSSSPANSAARPRLTRMGGRDHWPNAFSLALAGAGITGGRVYGAIG